MGVLRIGGLKLDCNVQFGNDVDSMMNSTYDSLGESFNSTHIEQSHTERTRPYLLFYPVPAPNPYNIWSTRARIIAPLS